MVLIQIGVGPSDLQPITTKNEQGKDQKFTFAIFPDYEIGHMAMVALLKEPRYLLTLEDLPRKYTGVEEGKLDTKEAIAYRDFLRKSTKFDMTRTLQSLIKDEFNILIKKMKIMKVGILGKKAKNIYLSKKVIGVKMIHRRKDLIDVTTQTPTSIVKEF